MLPGCLLLTVFTFQPLMKRFQKALKSHLDKVNEKVTLELKELVSKTLTLFCPVLFNIINFIILLKLLNNFSLLEEGSLVKGKHISYFECINFIRYT